MRQKIKAGDLEVGAIVWVDRAAYRVQGSICTAENVEILAVKLTEIGEIETVLNLPSEFEIEGHNRIDRLQLGRRYRLRDRVNFAEWIGDCLSVYRETRTYAAYTVLQVGTPLAGTHDTADIAVGEPEVIEDISPAPGQPVRIISESVEGSIVRQLPDGRWLVDCGDGVGEVEAEIFDLKYRID